MGIIWFVYCVIPGDSRGLRVVFSDGKFSADSESELEIMLHFVV